MSAVSQRARELLAAEYERRGNYEGAESILTEEGPYVTQGPVGAALAAIGKAMAETPTERVSQSARDSLAARYEALGTDYGIRKAEAIRHGDESGFVRTDIALDAIERGGAA